GSTLALNHGTLSLGVASEVDGSLIVDGSQLHLGGDLTLTGASQWLNSDGNIHLIFPNGHTITNRGTLTLGGPGSGDLRLEDNAGFTGGTLVNAGTITQQGNVRLRLNSEVVVNNTAQGLYDLTDDSSVVYDGGNDPGIVNVGTIRKSGGTGTSSL